MTSTLHADTFRAMDTDIDVVVRATGRPEAAFSNLRNLFEAAEDRFSRFRPQSALGRLNRGETVHDPSFARLVEAALEAHRLTGGLFNPMVLPALVAAGYAATFAEVAGGSPRAAPAPNPARCLRVEGDRVSLTDGALDLGGIAKGWTVDRALESLGAQFEAVLVNAGGDMRCSGSEDEHGGWAVAVEHVGGAEPAWEGRLSGALATCTTLRRRWSTDDAQEAHHLIDPATGLPAASPFVQVSAWAREAWLAEVWAKAVLVGALQGLDRAARAGVSVLAIPAQSAGPK